MNGSLYDQLLTQVLMVNKSTPMTRQTLVEQACMTALQIQRESGPTKPSRLDLAVISLANLILDPGEIHDAKVRSLNRAREECNKTGADLDPIYVERFGEWLEGEMKDRAYESSKGFWGEFCYSALYVVNWTMVAKYFIS